MAKKTKGKHNSGRLIFFLLILSVLIIFCKATLEKAFSSEYIQMDSFIPGILLSAFSSWLLIKIIEENKSIDLYESKLKVKWCWGVFWRNISPTEITLFSPTSNKDEKFLVIRIRKRDLLFKYSLLSNREEVVAQLTKWKIRKVNHIGFSEISKVETRVTGITLITSSLIIALKILSIHFLYNETIKKEDLVTIKGQLEYFSIDNYGGRSSSFGIDIFLKEYRNITFTVGNSGYHAADINLMKGFSVGTSVSLLVSKRERDLKISRSLRPKFSEKYSRWNEIEFYDLKFDDRSIFSFEEFRKNFESLKNNNKNWLAPLLLCLIGMMIYGYFLMLGKIESK